MQIGMNMQNRLCLNHFLGETLDDESTNQNKALTWLVCNDTISSNLIDDRDVETGELPKQIHGLIYTGGVLLLHNYGWSLDGLLELSEWEPS